MIKDINIEDEELIKKLENSFSSIFTKENHIKNDFFNNIFRKYFIYLEKNNIIGFVNYDYIYDRFELVDIVIDKKYRVCGYGKILMEELIKRGKILNIKNITLEVDKSNDIAICLYEKVGFKKIAIRENYYKNGNDGYLMEKEMM